MLRNKTRERLTEEQQKQLEKVIESKLRRDELNTEIVIWGLTYEPEQAFKILKLSGEIKKEALLAIRGDVIAAFRYEHPEWDFAKKYTQDNYTEITEAIRKAAKGDEVLVHLVMEQIEGFVRSKFSEEIDRAIYLLMSKSENYYYGGLKAIGFSDAEARVLKEFAYVIGETIQKVKEIVPHIQKEEVPADEVVVPEEDIVDEACEPEKKCDCEKIKYLLENQSVILEIYKASDFLKKAEEQYDIEWLIKNRENIESLFTTISNLQ